MNKKAQAQIITTVLIVLLVLAAIIIVWQVVQNTVKQSAEEVESQSACIGINLEITEIDGEDVTVKRNIGGPDEAISVTIVVDGTVNEGALSLEPLQSDSYLFSSSIADGTEVEVAAKVGNVQCGVIDKETYEVTP